MGSPSLHRIGMGTRGEPCSCAPGDLGWRGGADVGGGSSRACSPGSVGGGQLALLTSVGRQDSQTALCAFTWGVGART